MICDYLHRLPDEAEEAYGARLCEHLYARLQQAFEARQPCVVCGRPPVAVALFFPTDSERWGNTRGGDRVIVYSACEVHQPDAEVCEEALMRSLTVAERRN